MELYHWVMIVFGGLSISGSLIYFAVQVLRYLWRIEHAVDRLVEQNKDRDTAIQDIRKVLELHSAELNIAPEMMLRKRAGSC